MKIIELFKKLKQGEKRRIEVVGGEVSLELDIGRDNKDRYFARILEEGQFTFVGVITLAEVDAQCEVQGWNDYDWEIYQTRAELRAEVKRLLVRLAEREAHKIPPPVIDVENTKWKLLEY